MRRTVRTVARSRGAGPSAGRRARDLALVLALGVAVGLGIATLPPDDRGPAAAAAIEVRLVPLLGELDAIWLTDRDGAGSLARTLVELRDGAAAPAPERVDAWLQSHDTLVLRIVGLDLPVEAGGVQRQAVLAVTLSRDAVEVMARGASRRGAARDELLADAIRLRLRAEQVGLAALAAVDELRSGTRRISVPAPLPGHAELVG